MSKNEKKDTEKTNTPVDDILEDYHTLVSQLQHEITTAANNITAWREKMYRAQGQYDLVLSFIRSIEAKKNNDTPEPENTDCDNNTLDNTE